MLLSLFAVAWCVREGLKWKARIPPLKRSRHGGRGLVTESPATRLAWARPKNN